MDLYRQLILDHYKHPHHFGELKNPDIKKTFFNSACGDKITITLRVKGRKIDRIQFTGEGCAISMASASLLADEAEGKETGKILEMDLKTVTDLLQTDLTPSRVKCALLPLEAVQQSILELKKSKMV